MHDLSEQLKQRIDANPKIVEVARAIVRDHAEEIKRILVEDGYDHVKAIGRLHDLVRREAPRDDPTATPTPTDSGDPGAAQGAGEKDAIDKQVTVILVLVVLVLITL